MEKHSSRIEEIQGLGVIESVIANKIASHGQVNSSQIIREFKNHSKRLSPNERRAVLNEGFTEAVAAYIEANSLPDTHPQKEYAELRAQTISEFMGWLGNASGDVANVKAGKNPDGTYQRITPLHYKASLAVDSYGRATKEGNEELAMAIQQTASHCFTQPLEELIQGAPSAVSAAELSSTLDKVRMVAEKSKGRAGQVLAAAALSLVAVASTASPSAANDKAPETAKADKTQANNPNVDNNKDRTDKMSPSTTSARPSKERVVIKDVGLSDVPAKEVNASPKAVNTPTASEGAGVASGLSKTPVVDTIDFTPEITKADLPAAKKTKAIEPVIPEELNETFAPEIIKADLPPVPHAKPREVVVPKEITESLVPETVKIDSGLDEKAPKVTIHTPSPEDSTAKPAPVPEQKPDAPAPTPEVTTEKQQFSLAAQKLIDRGGEWVNRGRLMKIYIDSGKMTPMHAAAFIGNFMVEAPGLDPATQQENGHGRGYGQWGNKDNPAYDRFGYDGTRGLVKFAKERGTSWEDFETQALFVLHELETTEKDAYSKIMATTTREEATRAVSKYYERPGVPHIERRIESANIVATGYNEELKAIRPAPTPAPATPEVTVIGHNDKEGMVGDIPYAYQLDNRWANMEMPDGAGPIGPVACNPTSLSMVAMAIGDKSATPDKVYARYIAENRIGHGGAHQQSILDLAPAFGLRANLVTNTDIDTFRKVINDGGKIILSGNTNGRLLPNPGHFVVVYGISESGNMLVADPGSPGNNGKEFSLQDQVNASNAIRARLGTSNAGLHYNAVALYPKNS